MVTIVVGLLKMEVALRKMTKIGPLCNQNHYLKALTNKREGFRKLLTTTSSNSNSLISIRIWSTIGIRRIFSRRTSTMEDPLRK